MADAMRRMGDEAARMRRLVDGLLDLARLDDLGVVAREPVDLGVLVRDVASDLRGRGARPGRSRSTPRRRSSSPATATG